MGIIASLSSTCEKCKGLNFEVCVEAAVDSKIIIGYKNISWMSRVESPQSKNT